MFQHTAARRRLDDNVFPEYHQRRVSTHSRLKAAGTANSMDSAYHRPVSTHSRLKAAGNLHDDGYVEAGFNTQPPEGGW